MLIDSKIYKLDIESIVYQSSIDWNYFRHKSFLISGATGLIGSLLVSSLAYANSVYNLDLKLHLIVRNIDKANRLFGNTDKKLIFIQSDIENFKEYNENIDFIIHAASQTSSKGFIEKPVETFNTTLHGTMNMLEIAKRNKIQKCVFLSTMEVYGTPADDQKITEDMSVSVLPSNVRNCYPISKIASENLCCSYASEYGIDVAVLRLTQTFGAGVDYNDGRVFAEFARCAIETRDIVLKTKGETKRSYLHTVDAVTAIVNVLMNRNKQYDIYNVANENTYCSIYSMAQIVANECSGGKIKVVFDEQDISKFGYAPTLHMNLDTKKIQSLGWKPKTGLKDMFDSLITFMKE